CNNRGALTRFYLHPTTFSLRPSLHRTIKAELRLRLLVGLGCASLCACRRKREMVAVQDELSQVGLGQAERMGNTIFVVERCVKHGGVVGREDDGDSMP